VEDIMKSINSLFGTKIGSAIIAVLLITAAFIITSCGGGGNFAGGGISGTGRTTGVITAFGSIFVNGTEYQITSAAINVNDNNNATESDLKVGMKVSVEAVNNEASSVSYEPEVVGAVSNKNTDAFGVRSFDVLGQKVIVNNNTTFCFSDERENCTFSFIGLNDGDFVEVSGFFDSNGNIIATLVKKEDQDPREYSVKGIVSNLHKLSRTFSINSLTVDYSGIYTPSAISDGSLVRVKGTLNLPLVLSATEVEIQDTQATKGQYLSLEGIVTRFNSKRDFDIDGQPVRTDNQTHFDGDPALLTLNIQVEVKGTVDSNGVLVAGDVEIEELDIED
jgi:cytochrome c-type biogenesis protein CcmE